MNNLKLSNKVMERGLKKKQKEQKKYKEKILWKSLSILHDDNTIRIIDQGIEQQIIPLKH